MKKILTFLTVIGAIALFWLVFALWTGLYSVYTFPPSKTEPTGKTLIVSREPGEPIFNSPEYTPPPKPKQTSGMIKFEAPLKAKKPLEQRTIVTLPYIDWAYQKSLEPGNSGD